MENSLIIYSQMFDKPKRGITAVWGDPAEVVGEQAVELENGERVEQWIYHLLNEPTANGEPLIAMKGNLTIIS